MDMDKEFEQQFSQTDLDKQTDSIKQSILIIAESWPDFLAAWNGMIRQAVAEGWTPEIARSMVLQTVVPDSTYLAVTHRNIED